MKASIFKFFMLLGTSLSIAKLYSANFWCTVSFAVWSLVGAFDESELLSGELLDCCWLRW